jgi:hypothetical protein
MRTHPGIGMWTLAGSSFRIVEVDTGSVPLREWVDQDDWTLERQLDRQNIRMHVSIRMKHVAQTKRLMRRQHV